MPKKTQQASWIWVEGRAFDSRGVRQWYPLYNHRTEHEAQQTLRLIENGVVTKEKVNRHLLRYDDFRIGEERDHVADMRAATEKAVAGKCPACGKKPGKHQKGKWKQRPALRCSRCGHKWAVGPPEIPAEGATSPSKGRNALLGLDGAARKGKKAQKSKKKGKKKA